jgi:hypothetical protein
MVVVWSDREAGAAGAAPATGAGALRHQILEVSAYTGQVLYEGQARSSGPVSSQELKLLAAMLTVIMAVILIFVFRPEGAGATVSLPRQATLCDPARRIGAALFDGAASALIASQVTGASLAEVLSPWGMAEDGAALVTLGLIAAIGFAQCTLGECLWGRSLGKAIAGCAVAVPRTINVEGRLTPILERPSFWRAAVRNIVKWVLPPVALAGVFSGQRRHKGDLLAGTVVVVPVEEGETEGGGEG